MEVFNLWQGHFLIRFAVPPIRSEFPESGLDPDFFAQTIQNFVWIFFVKSQDFKEYQQSIA